MDAVVLALEGAIAPMDCFFDDRDGRVLCSHERDAEPLRHQAAVDARADGRHQVPAAHHAGRARRVRRPPSTTTPSPRRRPEPYRRSMADLEIKNLHVSAGDKQILKGVDLHVRSGEFHALMGPNGSGKSTLANAIMGHPNLEVTRGPDPVRRRGHHRGRSGRARPRRPVHGLPVPGRDPGRDGREVPAHGHERAPRGARRAADLAEGVPPDASRPRWSSRKVPQGVLAAATSTTASRAARRSAWRSSSSRCRSPSWPCSTRPTRASTSTR